MVNSKLLITGGGCKIPHQALHGRLGSKDEVGVTIVMTIVTTSVITGATADYPHDMTEYDHDNPLLTGLEPVHDRRARVVVLGSMPGARSLDMQAYYAHPRNAFWPIMEALFGIPCALPYAQRLAGLSQTGSA